MLIKIKSIHAKHIFGFEELTFNFESGIHNVSAPNGSGKTSIFLVLQQCFYNKNSKVAKIENVSNIVTGKPYSITAEFTKDNDEYKIENARDPNKIEIFKNKKKISGKGIPANLKLIEEILNCDYDTFTTLVLQESDSTIDLVEDSKDSARKEFCNSALDFNKYDTLQALFEAKRKELTGKTGRIALLQKQIDTLESGLGTIEEVEQEQPTEELQNNIKEVSDRLEELKSTIANITAQLNQVNQQLQEVELEKATYEKRSEIEASIENLELPEEDAKSLEDKLVEVERQLSTITERTKALTKEQAKLESALASGDCPTCGNKVDPEVMRKELLEVNELLDELKTNFNKQSEQKAELKNSLSIHQRCATLVSQLNQLKLESKTQGYDVDKLRYQQFVMVEELDNYEYHELQRRTELRELTNELSKLDAHNTRQKTIKELNEKIAKNNAKIKLQLISSKKELESLESSLELIELWLKILGPKGIRVVKMKSFLKQLNVSMNKYSAMLSEGSIKCKFYTTEDGKIEFKVWDSDKSLPFTNWSKGEKSRIKLGCLFAVLEVLEITGNCGFNVICLDEIFSSLDLEGKEGLLKVLEYLKTQGKCIYVISHSELFNNTAFDSEIKVVKTNGISKVII